MHFYGAFRLPMLRVYRRQAVLDLIELLLVHIEDPKNACGISNIGEMEHSKWWDIIMLF